uniref:Uncharacterized protein n=1 Tax=Solanum lycopersicum TaxID=4081 RepID=K4D1K3_SOLLC
MSSALYAAHCLPSRNSNSSFAFVVPVYLVEHPSYY